MEPCATTTIILYQSLKALPIVVRLYRSLR